MKIKFVPSQPHCFAFGGFEIQMLSAFNGLKKENVIVSKLNPWEKDSDFDIIHCWGFGFNNISIVEWARVNNKKVVITGLLSYYETLTEKIKYIASSLIDKMKFYKQIAKKVDAFVVVNDLQYNVARKYLNIPSEKIYIIPNIVSDEYFNLQNDNIPNYFQFTNYLLCTGNVCRRKNQLNLAKACLKTNTRLMIVGKVLDGEEEYGKMLSLLINKNDNIRWIKELEYNSKELLSAYKYCNAFALPSYVEQQPISLLEASASCKPILTANRAYGKQNYYGNAMLVEPENINSISEGVINIQKNPLKYIVPKEILEECREVNVVQKYHSLYKSLMS